MDAIRIPSPSAILGPPPQRSAAWPKSINIQHQHQQQDSEPSPEKKWPPKQLSIDPARRPKQSKSRNGCTTCKAKRLKCDETKPSCQQCQRRNVACGGYKKDFKWRPFGETMSTARSYPKKKASPPPDSTQDNYSASPSSPPPRKAARRTSAPTLPIDFFPEQDLQFLPKGDTLPEEINISNHQTDTYNTSISDRSHSFSFCEDLLDTFNVPMISETPGMAVSGFMLSDTSLDPLFHSLPIDLGHPSVTLASGEPSFSSMLEEGNDETEGIVGQPETKVQLWPVEESSLSPTVLSPATDLPTMTKLLQQPKQFPGSEEGLIVRFDRSTCGILSVKDGLTENPWRTFIWPMARECPALWHAVFAMAAFHSSNENPDMRVLGIEHMRKSINYMVQGMAQMQIDAALATTLSLAFAESWDQQTSTGILHLKGAKALMRQTLKNRLRRDTPVNELRRLHFLYNTWLYMDVIARLTSVDESDKEELGGGPFSVPATGIHDVDPLMGCATTLFPLIGKVANLIQRVRKSEKNSFVIISQARELKNAIDRWDLPMHFNPPDDPQSELQDSIQTAYAYRWAVLLYLHQAVPEIPSPSSAKLADNTLKLLATVPLSSRTNIVHIFPLFAASCEFENEESREWIMDRWKSMQNRLQIGNIDRCVDVIREVWRRRDLAKVERGQMKSLNQEESISVPLQGIQNRTFCLEDMSTTVMGTKVVSTHSTVEELDIEQTVRGKQHWVGVMKDWNWEVLLG